MAQNFDLQQTGAQVQERINQVPINESDISNIEVLIPDEASEDNKLVDKAYVDAIDNNLQQQIDEIVGGDATVSLAASPTTIFVSQQYNINLTATTNKNASSIKIKKAGTQIATGSGTSLSHTDTVTADATGTISYSAEFVISGVTRTASRNVTAVLPLYYGVGTSYPEEMAKDNTPRVASSFNYSGITTADGDHLYFEVPNNMKLTSLELVSTYNTPLSFETITSEREGYKAYRNTEPRGAGTFTYRLTIANN